MGNVVSSDLLFADSPAPLRNGEFDTYFLQILRGFYKNARATSKDYVVCDYPDGTKIKTCCTPSGKTYVSVARMLPAMVEWLAAGRPSNPLGEADTDIGEVVTRIYKNAFDPNHPDFWGYAQSDKPTQRSVEAALVAVSLAKAGKDLLGKLTPQDRTNIQKWLASCTQVPERKNNHAWFTACNQAARLELSRTFPEFQGDEQWMLEDLKAMDELGAKGMSVDGWYSDSPDQPIYDVYNFYVFPNFPLMWGRIIGARYPEWNEKFRGRIKTFLQKTPYFFAANGSHPLMGRSLVYRWAVLSPLVMGYREGLWPHSPGLLRGIVRRQLEYHWGLGCFDEAKGKLRETFSRDDTPVTREPYIDNGHPYWTMLGFAFLGIPESDPFWTAPEEPLPVEKDDFLIRFEGPKFLLSGNKRTGEVRWIQSQNAAKRNAYRDKYSKFAWSSHFGFNHRDEKAEGEIPSDQNLVFRNIETGLTATRAPAGATDGKLLEDGVETTWFAQLGDWKFNVVSTVRIMGEYEQRTHKVTAPPEAVGKVEVMEGTYAIPGSGAEMVHIWPVKGYERVESSTGENLNLIHKHVTWEKAIGKLSAAEVTLACVCYASPKPLAKEDVMKKGDELAANRKG